jgi:hypothetical protein
MAHPSSITIYNLPLIHGKFESTESVQNNFYWEKSSRIRAVYDEFFIRSDGGIIFPFHMKCDYMEN